MKSAQIEKACTRALRRVLRKHRLSTAGGYVWFGLGARIPTIGNMFEPIACTNRARRRLNGARTEIMATLTRAARAAGLNVPAHDWRIGMPDL